VDIVVTPERVVRCPRARRSPPRLRWDELTDEKIASIPLLTKLASEARRR
jgi:5-formyltetrahydrofolate cyclo-ligase